MTAAYTSMHQYSNCCSSFAAGTSSAHHRVIMDTAVIAVSIFISVLIRLLVPGCLRN